MFSVKDVAHHLSLSPSKVYELVDQGKIGHHRMDGAIRISQKQLEEYLKETERERRDETPKKRKPRRPGVELKYL